MEGGRDGERKVGREGGREERRRGMQGGRECGEDENGGGQKMIDTCTMYMHMYM